MSGLIDRAAAALRAHIIRRTPRALTVDPKDARTRWSQYRAIKQPAPSPPNGGTPMEPRFTAVWEAIKGWDLSRRVAENGERWYDGATGDDVWTILAALDAVEPQKFEELRFPLTEADNDADYWRARCELAEADADRLYTFTDPDRHVSPAVVEHVRNQHVDTVHYRTVDPSRLITAAVTFGRLQ